jgi:hypothetical protein
LGREIHLYWDIAQSKDPHCTEKLKTFFSSQEEKTGVPVYFHLGLRENVKATLRMPGVLPLRRDKVSLLQGLIDKEPIKIEFL